MDTSWVRQGLCLVGLAVVAGVACRGGGTSGVSAALNAGVAMGVAAVNRGNGGCYSTCLDGMTCDPMSGLCRRACAGGCASGQVCVDGVLCLTIRVATATVFP